MKKIYLSIIIAAFVASMSGQTVNVHFKNGQVIEYPSGNVDYVDFSAKPSDPTVTAGQVVDLGLSVYWASCNLGAEKPEEYGDYYAWGETKTKNNFHSSRYSFYDANKDEYINIGNDICGTQYDAATVNLGGDWQMPTMAEIDELINNCNWEWSQINNVNGYKVIGKNGNSIFLPSSGMYANSSTRIYDKKKEGVKLWTGESKSAEHAEAFYSNNNGPGKSGVGRQDGLCIRPVTLNPNAGGDPIDHSQDYLVTDKISVSYTGGSTSSVNGVIQRGSVLNFKISNGSTESIELTGIRLINGNTGSEGNNALSENVTIAAGESKDYSITVGSGGISKPKARFTYKYNLKKYYVEASVPDM